MNNNKLKCLFLFLIILFFLSSTNIHAGIYDDILAKMEKNKKMSPEEQEAILDKYDQSISSGLGFVKAGNWKEACESFRIAVDNAEPLHDLQYSKLLYLFSLSAIGEIDKEEKERNEIFQMRGPLWNKSWFDAISEASNVFEGALPEKDSIEKGKALMSVAQLVSYIGDNGRAIELLTKVISIMPEDAEVYYNLGNSYFSNGELVKAEKSYKIAIEFKPDWVEALCNLGAMLNLNKKPEEAEQYLKKAINLNPKRQDLLANLCGSYVLMCKWEEVLNYGLKIRDMNLNSPIGHGFLIIVYLEKGQTDKALKEAEILKTLKLNSGVYLLYIACANKASNKQKEANDFFNWTAKVTPDLINDTENQISKWGLNGKTLELSNALLNEYVEQKAKNIKMVKECDTKNMKINEGEGILGITVANDSFEEITQMLGKPDKTETPSKEVKAKNYYYEKLGLTFNVYDEETGGKLNTIVLTSPFLGMTTKSIGIGSKLDEIITAYGPKYFPEKPVCNIFYVEEGIGFWLNSDACVEKIVVMNKVSLKK
ncbi:MAG: tetratricopeptide repeat protein [bacterium]|nr:tetratricopeptide repeat protein [bacterium]